MWTTWVPSEKGVARGCACRVHLHASRACSERARAQCTLSVVRRLCNLGSLAAMRLHSACRSAVEVGIDRSSKPTPEFPGCFRPAAPVGVGQCQPAGQSVKHCEYVGSFDAQTAFWSQHFAPVGKHLHWEVELLSKWRCSQWLRC